MDDQNFSLNNLNSSSTPPKRPQTRAYGIASLICGILSLLCCCCNEWFAFLIAVAAIIMFALEKVFVGKASGFAIAGLVCGIISLSISILGLLFAYFLEASGALDSMTEMLNSILGEYDNLYI